MKIPRAQRKISPWGLTCKGPMKLIAKRSRTKAEVTTSWYYGEEG